VGLSVRVSLWSKRRPSPVPLRKDGHRDGRGDFRLLEYISIECTPPSFAIQSLTKRYRSYINEGHTGIQAIVLTLPERISRGRQTSLLATGEERTSIDSHAYRSRG
jgi:hypothetical protein